MCGVVCVGVGGRGVVCGGFVSVQHTLFVGRLIVHLNSEVETPL